MSETASSQAGNERLEPLQQTFRRPARTSATDYEEDVLGFSYGFRPGRSQHDALDALSVAISSTPVNWILDADIRGFFDSVNQEWLVRFLEHQIGDERVTNAAKACSRRSRISDRPTGDLEIEESKGAFRASADMGTHGTARAMRIEQSVSPRSEIGVEHAMAL